MNPDLRRNFHLGVNQTCTNCHDETGLALLEAMTRQIAWVVPLESELGLLLGGNADCQPSYIMVEVANGLVGSPLSMV